MQYNRDKADCKNCCLLCPISKKMFCEYNCEKEKMTCKNCKGHFAKTLNESKKLTFKKL